MRAVGDAGPGFSGADAQWADVRNCRLGAELRDCRLVTQDAHGTPELSEGLTAGIRDQPQCFGTALRGGLRREGTRIGQGDDHGQVVPDEVVHLPRDPGAFGRGGQPAALIPFDFQAGRPFPQTGQLEAQIVTFPGPSRRDGLSFNPWNVPEPIVFSMDRARTELGYRQATSYDDALRQDIDWAVRAVADSEASGRSWQSVFPSMVARYGPDGWFPYKAEDTYLGVGQSPGSVQKSSKHYPYGAWAWGSFRDGLGEGRWIGNLQVRDDVGGHQFSCQQFSCQPRASMIYPPVDPDLPRRCSLTWQ